MANKENRPKDRPSVTASELEQNPRPPQGEGALSAESGTVSSPLNAALESGADEPGAYDSGPHKEPRRPPASEIAARAYELYRERGDEPGSDVEDWLRAERELRDRG